MLNLIVSFALAVSASPSAESPQDHSAEQPDKAAESAMASALSAGPKSVTDHATILDHQGNVLRKGSNGYTCMPESAAMGPMCNDAVWMAVLEAFMAGKPYDGQEFGLSYMLAGEGDAPGVSNIDPRATSPTSDNQWVKEGPHLMIILPDPSMYQGMSTDPSHPVYVMWKDTPYAHLMVRVAEETD